jgi:hypothetical protein
MRGLGLSVAGLASRSLTQIQQAISLLRTYGTNANAFVPGVGWLNGLQAANYLDSAGTTPGTVDQPVGLVLDAEGVMGVELVTNGDFSAGATGWTAGGSDSSFTGGVATLPTGNTSKAQTSAGITVAGKTYRVRYDVLTTNGGSLAPYFGGVTQNPYWDATSPAGTREFTALCTATGQFSMVSFGFVGTIDNVSVREITGIHASQSTTPSKPVLRRGAVNLLPYSQANSNWVSDAASTVVTDNSAVGVQGAATASTFTITGAGYKYGAAAANTSLVMTGCAWIKGASGTVALRLASNGSAETASTVVTLTGEWQFVVVQLTSTGAPGSYKLGIDNRALAGADTITKAVMLDGAALFQGTYTSSQIQALGGIPLTTTAPASTALGPYFWQFDGVDDSLANLSTAICQLSDDHCFGVAGQADSSATGVFLSQNGSANSRLQLYQSGTNLVMDWADDAAVTVNKTIANAVGSKFVASVRSIGGNKTLSLDSVVSGITSTAQGTGTFTDFKLGANGVGVSSANFQKGRTFAAYAIKGSVSDADRLVFDRLLASLQGRTI